MNQQDATRIKELGLMALKDTNPDLRKEALLELRHYNTTIITEVLERVIQKDRDKTVRDLAQNLLTKQRIKDAQRTSPVDLSPSPQDTLETDDPDLWTCSFCGSQITDTQICPNCGAARKEFRQKYPAPTSNDVAPFLLNPSHRDFVLGKSNVLSRSSFAGTGCLVLFMSFFVGIGLFVLMGVFKETYEWFMISQRGVTITAEYTDRRISSGDESDNYYVSFRYTHNDREYAREQRVDWYTYNAAESGLSVPIVYVPSNPQLAKVAGTNNPPTGILVFVLVWNGIVWTVIYFGVRQYRRHKFLERNGKMLRGEILESTHSTDSDGDLSLRVEFAFQSPQSSRRLTKTDRAQRNDLKGKRPPAPGTPIVILYYNDHQYMLL